MSNRYYISYDWSSSDSSRDLQNSTQYLSKRNAQDTSAQDTSTAQQNPIISSFSRFDHE